MLSVQMPRPRRDTIYCVHRKGRIAWMLSIQLIAQRCRDTIYCVHRKGRH